MASSTSSITCNFHCNHYPSLSLPTSATRFSLSFSHPLLSTYNGLSLHHATSTSRIFAKFEKFQTQPSQSQEPEPDPSSSLEEITQTSSVQDGEEDDRYYTTLHLELSKLCFSFSFFSNLCVASLRQQLINC